MDGPRSVLRDHSCQGSSPTNSNLAPARPYVDFSVGTDGGSFTFQGNMCDYGVVLAGTNCDGEVQLGAPLDVPDDTGLSLGDVVSVSGSGTAQGFFCWVEECNQGLQSIFDLEDVRATYQFTLTEPGTITSFSWTGAEIQFRSCSEPGTLVFATLGLVGVAVGWRGRRCRSQSKPVAKKDCILNRQGGGSNTNGDRHAGLGSALAP